MKPRRIMKSSRKTMKPSSRKIMKSSSRKITSGCAAPPAAQSAVERLGQGRELAAAAFPYRSEGPQEPLGAATLRAESLASPVGSRLPPAQWRSAAMEHRERREWARAEAPPVSSRNRRCRRPGPKRRHTAKPDPTPDTHQMACKGRRKA